MGVIAQDSTNLLFDRFVVEPSGDRKFSLAADGTHFVSCRGELRFVDCRIQNQFDDAINTHGIYQGVIRQMGPRRFACARCTRQHQGCFFYRSGDEVSWCRGEHLESAAKLTVESCSPINSEFCEIVFSEDLPAGMAKDDLLENLNAYPRITIERCDFRWNRARGILMNGPGPILVKETVFETPGAAIMVESSRVWGESGPVGELAVEGNTFKLCGTCAMWGDAVIQARNAFRADEGGADEPPFHGRLVLANNTFADCPAPALKVDSFREVEKDF